jgi:ADP-ribose pyrophosphatase YjhB (NUDIX family)
MTKWRPAPGIRVKALGLHWRGDALLVMDVFDDAGRVKGVRPLGGTVEFGETWQDTLIREFQEELSVDVQITSAPLFVENIYWHEGVQGHEVLFLATVTFPDGAFAGQDEIHFAEDNGVMCRASWRSLASLRSDRIALYPDGLVDVLADPKCKSAAGFAALLQC